MPSLKIINLSKTYNQPLLNKVNLSYSGSDRIALIGDNGAGKSTLLKMLAFLEQPETGQLHWEQSPRIGYMTQEISDHPTLSGGQKKIAKLAEIIYTNQFDVILLDEPDNHLDTEGKQWLIEALNSFDGLVIYISHDRNFLRNTATKVWLVEDKNIRTFPFGFEKFEAAYLEDFQAKTKLYKLQLSEKKRLEAIVARLKLKARDPKSAKRYKAAISRLNRYIKDMIPDPNKNTSTINLKEKELGKVIKRKTAIIARDLYFSYPSHQVLAGTNLHAFVQEKIGLLAPNGAGKTTFIKLLLEELKPNSGSAKLGTNMSIGYYSQEHFATLPANKTPLEIFTHEYPLHDWEVEAILKDFLFTKGQMKTKIDKLSGGQRSRLQLALFLNKNPDLLILDEPTNHLDLKSIAALENFLINFKGTILLVSHDHDLVKNVCNRIFTIKDNKIIQFKTQQ